MLARAPTATLAHSIGLAAAVLALWLRLLVPVGWMPVASVDGVVFTLCSGSGDQQVVVGKAGQAPDSGVSHDGPCAFSGLGSPALPELPPAVALQIFLLFIALGLAATPPLRLVAVSWLRPPLRGPPSRV